MKIGKIKFSICTLQFAISNFLITLQREMPLEAQAPTPLLVTNNMDLFTASWSKVN